MSQWHIAGDEDDFPEGQGVAIHIAHQSLALFRLEGRIYALHDQCPHGKARLSEGFVEQECVECPLHQGRVDIRTGAPRGAPITVPVRSFPVRVTDGRVEVHVE